MHIKRIHEMIESLTECTKEAIESDQTCVGSYPIGEVVDMIKDLADAEYHARIAKAMEEAEEDDKEEEKYLLKRFKEEYGDDEGRRYYDEWRYSSGRFAPKGRGMRRGFDETPYWHMTPEMYRDMDIDIPTWDDMCVLKDIFFDDEEEVYQIHPKKSEYVNMSKNCLHLWKPIGHELGELVEKRHE